MRTQERKPDGRFTPTTLTGSFGLANKVCAKCGGCNPWKVGIEPKPERCGQCGAAFDDASKAEVDDE